MVVVAALDSSVTFGASSGTDNTVTFDSVAAFRASSDIPPDAVSVITRGYYGPNTPGGNTYLIDRLDSSTADNGGTTLVNNDGLRIKLPESSVVHSHDFGARGDNGLTNNNNALLAAVATGKNVHINADNGYYLTTVNIPVSSNQKVFGDGFNSYIKNEASTAFPDALTFSAGWIQPNDYDQQTYYFINPVSIGDQLITFATSGDSSNFTAGDLCIVYAGYPNGDDVRENSPALFIEIHEVLEVGSGTILLDSSIEASVAVIAASAGTWDAGTTYSGGDTVEHNGDVYLSKIDNNIGNEPADDGSFTNNEWSRYYVAVTKMDQGQSFGKNVELVKNIEISNLRVSTNNNAWLGRCAIFRGYIHDIFVERSNRLVLGNGFAQCLIENVEGYFTNEFCEAAEGTYGTKLKNIRGIAHPQASLATYPVNLTRPVEMENCTVDFGNKTATHLFQVGCYYEGYSEKAFIKFINCNFNVRVTANIFLFTTGGRVLFQGNQLNNNEVSCSRVIFHEGLNDADYSRLINNRFLGLNVTTLIDLDGNFALFDGNYFQETADGTVVCANLINSIFRNNQIDRSAGFNFTALGANTIETNNTYTGL